MAFVYTAINTNKNIYGKTENNQVYKIGTINKYEQISIWC